MGYTYCLCFHDIVQHNRVSSQGTRISSLWRTVLCLDPRISACRVYHLSATQSHIRALPNKPLIMHLLYLIGALSTGVLGVALPAPNPEPNPTADPGLIINIPTIVPSGLPSDDIYIYFDLDPLTSQIGKSTEAVQIAAGAFWLTAGPPLESPDETAAPSATATAQPSSG
jgi:hypothetical protein